MKYLPLSAKDRAEMLQEVGARSLDDLFVSIPEHLRLKEELDLPAAKSEMEVLNYFSERMSENQPFRVSFLGAGAYRHFCPSVVDALASRQEFLTAYTPYQPEVSQGTLQALFEFQTLIADIMGMDVSNASVYDGATGTAEAVLMALRIQKKRKKVLVSDGLHPHYRDVLNTYVESLDLDMETVPLRNNATDLEALKQMLDKETVAVLCGYPNFLGQVEPLCEIVSLAQEHKALVISVTMEALSLALLKPPGEFGVDIAVGEAQSFGIPLQFGGPYCGIFTCKDKYKRQMPGRLCGQTLDSEGKRAFVLTLNAREQHIRRAKATSNICTNQGLMTLRVAIYLELMGQKGIRELAEQNHAKAEFLKRGLAKLPGVTIDLSQPTFNEFTVELPVPASQVVDHMLTRGIQAGLDLGRFFVDRENELLVNVTECHTRGMMEEFVGEMEAVL
ncbi:MAG: aminomethyl-transferring glycine dehydrogenase [Acidobacteria bacterium]|nr:MAG: aminomethyl-transferring glycine dehydrogenase [Acidobacteriota bacterium]